MFAKIANRKSILNIGSNKNFSSKGIDNLKKSIEKEIIHEETNYQGVYVEDTKKFLNDTIMCINATLLSGFIAFFFAETVFAHMGFAISGIMTLISLGLFMS